MCRLAGMGYQLKDQGFCCFFCPLRFGASLISMHAFCYGIFMSLVFFEDEPRLIPGGYDPKFKWWSVVLGSLGIIFGLMGIMAIYDNKEQLMKIFAYYEWSKVVLAFIVFIFDEIALRDCDQWQYSISSQISVNTPLENLSTKMLCGSAKKAYQYGFVVDWGLQVYFAYVIWRYYSIMCERPAYLVKFDGAWEPQVPTRMGEPTNFFINQQQEAEYAALRDGLEEKLYTNAMGDKEFRGGFVDGSMAGTKEYGASSDYTAAEHYKRGGLREV